MPFNHFPIVAAGDYKVNHVKSGLVEENDIPFVKESESVKVDIRRILIIYACLFIVCSHRHIFSVYFWLKS